VAVCITEADGPMAGGQDRTSDKQAGRGALNAEVGCHGFAKLRRG
jgi:hypothetical protein